MHISSTSTAYGGGEAQRLLARLLQRQGPPAGQDLPSGPDASATAPAPSPTPPSGGPGALQLAASTLSSLLGVQQGPPSSADIAQKVISAADTDGDGSLSLSEVEKALGQDATSSSDGLSKAFGGLDSNGDGKLSQSELASALDAQRSAGAHHGRHGHHAHGLASSDLAAKILGKVDTDGDGALSGDEIAKALGVNADGLRQAISGLDKNGDGKLDSSELTAAIDAFRTAHRQGQGADGASQTVSA